MANRITYIMLMSFALLVACVDKKQPPPPTAVENKPEYIYTEKGSVREMILMPEPPGDFPDYEGKSEFMSYCGVCHSLKYITTQPDFTRKTWEAIVHKMIEKYGAPIDTARSNKIVDYLVAVKGVK